MSRIHPESLDCVMHVKNVFRALVAIASPTDKYFCARKLTGFAICTPVSFANGKPLAADRATLQRCG